MKKRNAQDLIQYIRQYVSFEPKIAIKPKAVKLYIKNYDRLQSHRCHLFGLIENTALFQALMAEKHLLKS